MILILVIKLSLVYNNVNGVWRLLGLYCRSWNTFKTYISSVWKPCGFLFYFV